MRAGIITLMAIIITASVMGGEVNAPKIKATVTPEKATVGTVLDYRVNVAGKGLGAITIVPPEKREVYPEKRKPRPRPPRRAKRLRKTRPSTCPSMSSIP